MNTLDTPILIAYDRSEGSRRAITKTAELFPGKTAIILHVWSPLAIIAAAYGGAVTIPSYDDNELQKAARPSPKTVPAAPRPRVFTPSRKLPK